MYAWNRDPHWSIEPADQSSWLLSNSESRMVDDICEHLCYENIPDAEDCDVEVVKQWIVAINPKLRTKEIKRLAFAVHYALCATE
jgi:hypothetical protein